MATPTTLPATFTAGQVLTAAQMNDLRGAFRVLQVVSTTKTDAFTSTSTSFADVTGLSLTITPSATSSKILVFGSLTGSNDQAVAYMGARMMRDTTPIMVGDTAGNRTSSFNIFVANAEDVETIAGQVLDSPASTSALTYKWQVATIGGGTCYVNRSKTDTNVNYNFRTASSITALEISA